MRTRTHRSVSAWVGSYVQVCPCNTSAAPFNVTTCNGFVFVHCWNADNALQFVKTPSDSIYNSHVYVCNFEDNEHGMYSQEEICTVIFMWISFSLRLWACARICDATSFQDNTWMESGCMCHSSRCTMLLCSPIDVVVELVQASSWCWASEPMAQLVYNLPVWCVSTARRAVDIAYSAHNILQESGAAQSYDYIVQR